MEVNGHSLQKEMRMSSNAIEVAKSVFNAYVSKDRAAIEALIPDDFRFTSPLDNGIDRRAYFERCWPNSEHIAGFRFIHLAEAGDQVFVTYEGRSVRGKGFRNTEVLTIRDGKLVSAEVYFGWDVPHELAPGTSRP
jgi:ketosteroid isomerase-like protein